MTWIEKEELRKEYSILHDLLTLNMPGHEITREKRLKSTADFKRRLRGKVKRYNNKDTDDIHYSEDGESCWWKEYFDEPFTEEEKREFIEDRWVHIYSPYDCTGQWFTSRIAICNVNTSFGAKSVAYFKMGLDV